MRPCVRCCRMTVLFECPSVASLRRSFEPIEELRIYLTQQLEAHLNKDWETYEKLEEKILELEKKL